MQAITDLHTHTAYSHGKGTIEDNVCVAMKRGLQAVGIADHGPNHFFIGIGGVEAFRRMKNEIEALRHKYPEIKILFGVEANIVDTDGTIDVSAAILRELDFLLVGYHKMVRPRSLAFLWQGVRNFCSGWTKTSSALLRAANTAAITAAVRRYPIAAITHPGLQIDIDTAELGRVCKEYGTSLEINSSYGSELDPYIREALPTGVRFLLSSDAHVPERVGDFSQAYQLIRRLNIPEERIVNLEK
ncbi:MAG: PHP domain-containing protein [Dethiobacter sp.]|nr:PHP domain-containing protein [Dethiobacter sp.]MBS3901266.1 PHP domain-containing protein [Dethiobacter sp.]MBS3989091.1 PHP domain-containing protein [Dethiobacter sp.]